MAISRVLPYWVLRLLPMWDYICPKCKREVQQKTHKCPYCGENYGVPLHVPSRVLKDPKALEDYVHQHVFPKISARQRDYLTQFFTEIFSDGFESGNFNAWTGTETGGNGSITVVSDQTHHGSYSAYSNAPASGYADVYKTLATSQSECYIRWYVRFNTLPSSDGNKAPILRAGGTGTELVRFYIKNASGQLQILGEFFPWVTTATYNYNFQTGVWYCFEYGYKKGTGSDGFHKVWLDGTLVINLENRDHTSVGDAESYKVGNCYLVSGYTSQLWIDCVTIADTYIGTEGIFISRLLSSKFGIALIKRVLLSLSSLIEFKRTSVSSLHSLLNLRTLSFRANYSLKQFISKILSGKFLLRNLRTKIIEIKYNLSGFISIILSSLYSFAGLITRTLITKFSILKTIRSVMSSLYSNLMILIKSSTFIYNLRNIVQKIMSFKYIILSFIKRVLTSFSNLSGKVSNILRANYSLLYLQIINKSMSMVWSLRNLVSSIKISFFSLENIVYNLNLLRYNLRNNVSSISRYIYNSLVFTIKKFAILFNVLGKIFASRLTMIHVVKNIREKLFVAISSLRVLISNLYRTFYLLRIKISRLLSFLQSIISRISRIFKIIYISGIIEKSIIVISLIRYKTLLSINKVKTIPEIIKTKIKIILKKLVKKTEQLYRNLYY